MTHQRRIRLSCVRLVGAALAGMLVVSGCSDGKLPAQTASPTPSAGATGQYLGFDTEAEAIAAAEAVYAQYRDSVADYWAGIAGNRPADYLMGRAYEAELEFRALVESQGLRLTEVSESETLSTRFDDPEVVLTTCERNGGRILDSNNADVTPSDRPEKQAFEIRIQQDADGTLRISSSDTVDDPGC